MLHLRLGINFTMLENVTELRFEKQNMTPFPNTRLLKYPLTSITKSIVRKTLKHMNVFISNVSSV